MLALRGRPFYADREMGSQALETKHARKRVFRVPTTEERTRLAACAVYEGRSVHKKHPHHFGLVAPAGPRADKTLCDEAGIVDKASGYRLFQRALRVGLVSEAVVEDGLPNTCGSSTMPTRSSRSFTGKPGRRVPWLSGAGQRPFAQRGP